MTEEENNPQIDYKKKDIVWAKVKENPWWPAIIIDISFSNIQTFDQNNNNQKIYSIELIGLKKTDKISQDKIAPFLRTPDLYINPKNSSLLHSIELAKQMINKIKSTKNNSPTDNNEKQNKKENQSQEGQNLASSNCDIKEEGNKQKEKKFLQKKRTSTDKTINNEAKDREKKEEENEVGNEGNASSQNNIKINININLTTNNQNTVNINSFNNQDINSSQNNNKNIINSTPKDNNEEEIIEEKNKNEEKNVSIEGIDDIEEEDGNEDEDLLVTKDIINDITQKLLSCQVQLYNSTNQKMVNNELKTLKEKLEEIFSKSQKNEEKNIEIYKLTKDLIPVLINFTYNKNKEIVINSTEIVSILNEKIIKEIFFLSQNDKKLILEMEDETKNENMNLEEIDEKDYKMGLNLIEMINRGGIVKSNISENQNSMNFKRGRPKKGGPNSEQNTDIISKINEDSMIFKDNLNGKKVYNEFIKFISSNESDKMENDFKEMSQNFFNNIYDKNNTDLDFDVAKVRKKLCIKIFKLLNKIFPDIKKDFLKKVIIFFEYKIRNDESNFDKLYSSKLNGLIQAIKDKFCNIKN